MYLILFELCTHVNIAVCILTETCTICSVTIYRLSEREKLDYAYKKKLYQLANEHEKVSNIQCC